MDPIAKDATEAVVSDAWVKNMLALFRLFGRSLAVEYIETPLLARWHARLSHPYFEGVQVFQSPPDQVGAIIQEQSIYFKSRGAKFFSWWLQPPLTSADWKDTLTAQDFIHDPGGPYMALFLDELPDSVRWPEGLEIRVVEDNAALRVWIETFACAYEFPVEWKEPFAGIYSAIGFDLPLRHYLAFLHGTPVAASTLFLAEGVAGIWNVATLTGARGQGIGSAITWKPLWDARQEGYSIAALDSTKMGYPVYERLGFRDIACPGNFIKAL